MNDASDPNETDPDDRPLGGKRKAPASSSQSAGKRRCDRNLVASPASDDEDHALARTNSSVQRRPGISVEIPAKDQNQSVHPDLEELGIFDFLTSRESSPVLPPSQRYTMMSGGLGSREVKGRQQNTINPTINSSSTLVGDRRHEGDANEHSHKGSEPRLTCSPAVANDDPFVSRYRVDEERQMIFDEDDNIILDGTNLNELDDRGQVQSSPCPAMVRSPGRSGSASVEDAAAAAQLQSEAQHQHASEQLTSGRTVAPGHVKHGSRSNPLEIRSGSETEQTANTRHHMRTGMPPAQQDRLQKKNRDRQQWESISGQSSSVSLAEGSPRMAQTSRHIPSTPAAAKPVDSSDRPSADKQKHPKVKKERHEIPGNPRHPNGTRKIYESPGRPRHADETKREYKSRIKKENKERNMAKTLKEIPDHTSLNSIPLERPTGSSRITTSGRRHPRAQTVEPGSSSKATARKVQANAALKRDKEVRLSAPAPAFMTRQLGFTEGPSGCGDKVVIDLTRDDSLIDDEQRREVEHESMLTFPHSRHDIVPSTTRPHPSPHPGSGVEAHLYSPSRHDSKTIATQPAFSSTVVDPTALPRAEGLTFNDRMIALREQMSHQSQTQRSLHPQSQISMQSRAPLMHMTRQSIKQGAYRPILPPFQGQYQTQNQGRQLPVHASRWLRPSWSRHSRSPSGESSYELWGLFRMRTTWDDDDHTIVDSDSELEIVGVPQPRRWGVSHSASSCEQP